MKVTAFGVTKTISEWEMDSRAAVYGELIVRRIEGGMTPERAISTPTVQIERGPTKYMAWGDRKTLRDWADDPRCRTSYENLKSRIGDDWDVIPALETPTLQRQPRPVTAWEETKSLRAWSLDERAGASYSVIQKRLEEGWDAERAISERTVEYVELTAWGETKSCKAWAEDERAAVGWNTILKRTREGMAAEEAITTPGRGMDREVTALGETKRLSKWLLDPRCVVDRRSFHGRIAQGFSDERALTEPLRTAETTTAWGETKSLVAWSKDPRAAVDDGMIRKRLGKGMTPEEAISTPVPPIRKGDVTAWGESKSLKAWAEDGRCSVSAELIGSRLRAGATPEEAISGPMKSVPVTLTAFGETKRLAEWEADPRARARRHTIQDRVAAGMAPEKAITTPTAESNRDGLTAFGEWKTFKAWGEDPRATVTEAQIADRIRSGMSPEEAITAPNRLAGAIAAAAAVPKPEGVGRVPSHSRFVTAFGETKTLHGWAADPRCVMSMPAFKARLDRGMTPEEAMTAEPERGVPKIAEAFGETKSIAGWSQDPRATVSAETIGDRLRAGWAAEDAISKPKDTSFEGGPREAFGEWKTLSEWAADPRSKTGYGNLVTRLAAGLTLEEALSLDAGVLRHGKYRETMEAFGERKTLGEWYRDPRLVVDGSRLGSRLRLGWDLEQAMTAPEGSVYHKPEKGTYVTAFGETKNLTDWAEDARCVASRWDLSRRLGAGWEVERAMTTPTKANPKGAGENHWRNAPRVYTAFGETKGLREWAEDPRCKVTLNCLRQRLKDGVPPEEALTRLAKPRYEDAVHTAFGMEKTLRAWSEDARCLVSYETLLQRVTKWGMTIELAILTPVGETGRIKAPKYRAFGKKMTVLEWAADARCVVSADTLATRLRSGWEVDEAITKPSKRAA